MRFRLDNGPLLAALLSVLLLLWMASGSLGRDLRAESLTGTESGRSLARERVRVQVRTLRARTIERTVILHGRTVPARVVELRAEAPGRVQELGAAEGQPVAAGALVAGLDPADVPARLVHARDVVRQRTLEFEGAERLHRQKLLSESGLAEARALLSAARAEADALSVRLRQARVEAPFDGMLDTRTVEIGDYLKAGDKVATVLDFRPLLVVGHVSETEAIEVRPGMRGEALLRDGSKWTGQVQRVGAVADHETRTHPVEFALQDTAELPRQAGITARVRIAVRAVRAHQLSPALLTLDPAGQLGVKVVDADEVARFLPVRLVRAGTTGAWVEGLPDTVRLITVGAGFVQDGDPVEAVSEPVTRAEAAS